MSDHSAKGKIKLADALPLAQPFVVYIELTNKCNFVCPWCPTGNHLQQKVTKNSGTMSLELFKKIVADCKALTTKTGKKLKGVSLYMMGESFIHKDAIQMIEYVRQADVTDNISISTNGSLLNNDDICQKLVDSKINDLSFSMYGTSNDDYKKVSPVFTFDHILQNAKRIKDHRAKAGQASPRIYFKFFDHTKVIDDMAPFLLEHCDEITFEEPFNWNALYTKETRIRIPNKKFDTKYCSSPWYVMALSWDGAALTCCSDWSWHTKVGNVREQSVEEIWKGIQLYQFRKNIVEGKQSQNPACNGCTFYKVNTGPLSSLDELIGTHPENALIMPS